MSGPLALLGDAIASGMAEGAAIRREAALHERTRAERRADISDARAHERAIIGEAREYEKGQRTAAWNREDQLYRERRFDAIKDQLVRDGFLEIADIGNPEAVNAALQRGGRDYQRALQELAEYKASIPSIIAATKGKASGVQAVLNMTPADIDQARQIMVGAYGTLEEAVKTDSDRRELNAQNGAALMMAHQGKLTALDARKSKLEDEFERLTSGELTPSEIAQVRQMALARLPQLAGKAVLTPNEQGLLNAEMAKQEQDVRLIGRHQLQQQARSIDNALRHVNTQYEGVKAAIQTGAAAYMTPGSAPAASLSADEPPPSAPRVSDVAPGAGTSEFVAALGGSPASPTAIPAPQAAAMTPVALGAPAPASPSPKIPPVSSLGDLPDAILAGTHALGDVLAADSYKPRKNWHDPILFSGPSESRQLYSYKTRLGQMPDRNSPRAQWLAAEIRRLEQLQQREPQPAALGGGQSTQW